MMLSDVSVRRPVFADHDDGGAGGARRVSYYELGLDLMPKTDAPVVTVNVQLPGASAEEVETQITKRVEEAVNTISGIDELRATSDQGSSRVSITFFLERDIESATQDVRDKIATIVGQFPRDTRPPQIQKVDPDAAPILTFALYGPRAPKELTEIAEKRIKQNLETLPDVGAGQPQRRPQARDSAAAQRRPAERVRPDGRSGAHGGRAPERRGAGRQLRRRPAEDRAAHDGAHSRTSTTSTASSSPTRTAPAITFADVGRVQDAVQEIRSATRIGRRRPVDPVGSISMSKQSGTNTVEVVDRVLARLDADPGHAAAGPRISIGQDQSRFIRRSFEDIQLHLLLGSFLACCVVFLFIRNLRVTLIAALAVPTSIIGTFTFMKAFGFTLNNMTMLALSLATGIVIDDAIVVLENIFRFVEEKGRHAAGGGADGDRAKSAWRSWRRRCRWS